MRFRAIKILTLLLAFTSFAFGQQSSSAIKTTVSEFDASKIQTVGYCELMSKPEDYVGKSIRLEAVLSNLISLESILYVECKPKISAVAVGFASDKFDVLSEEILSKMNSWQVRDAKVIVAGKFLGPRKPNSKFNYGHYGWSKYQFEIHALERIERVPEKK